MGLFLNFEGKDAKSILIFRYCGDGCDPAWFLCLAFYQKPLANLHQFDWLNKEQRIKHRLILHPGLYFYRFLFHFARHSVEK